MNFVKNIFTRLKNTNITITKINTSHVNSTNPHCPSTMVTSADLPASHSPEPLAVTTNIITEAVVIDEPAETRKDDCVDVADLTTMDSDIMTLDDSLSINGISQDSDDVLPINLDELDALMEDLVDESDGAPEASKLLEDGLITLDDILIKIKGECKDYENLNELQKGKEKENEAPNVSQKANTNECDPAIESTIKATQKANTNDCDPAIESTIKATQKENTNCCDPAIESTIKATQKANTNDCDPAIESTIKATQKANTNDCDPAIESTIKATQKENTNYCDPAVESTIKATQKANTNDCDPAIESTIKAKLNEPITESVCNVGEHEILIEIQTANQDNICDLTIESSSNASVDNSTVKDDTMNVQENIVDNGEVCSLQAPLKSFDVEDFEEQIQLFKIFQNEIEFPESHQEEELTRYLAELENKSEINSNVVHEVASNINTSEHKQNILESNNDIFPEWYINKVINVNPKDLNNAEIEFCLPADTSPCNINKEEKCPDNNKNNVITIEDSDVEIVSESDGKTEEPHSNKNIRSETPSTSENVLPSTTNNNSQKRNYINEETNNSNNKRTTRQHAIEIATPSLSNKAAIPPSNNNHQRDYKSLRLKFLADEEKRMRKTHRMPDRQEYYDLFREQHAPMFNVQNKSVMAGGRVCMDYSYGGVGIDVRCNMPREESSEEDKKSAEVTRMMILDMYSGENRNLRRKF